MQMISYWLIKLYADCVVADSISLSNLEIFQFNIRVWSRSSIAGVCTFKSDKSCLRAVSAAISAGYLTAGNYRMVGFCKAVGRICDIRKTEQPLAACAIQRKLSSVCIEVLAGRYCLLSSKSEACRIS